MHTIATASASFTRNIDKCLSRVEAIVADARERGADLIVLPDATLGGYLSSFDAGDEPADPPPAIDLDGDEIRRVAAAAGPAVVCLGCCEADGPDRYNTAVCVSGDGILGTHRKVHLPPADRTVYRAGDSFEPFDTPVGRLGMLIDYDKTFPESARSLATQGAKIVTCLCAWPASLSVKPTRIDLDPQSRLFDLYDRARAAENQIVWVSANQCGKFGQLRFLGQSKIVDPGGQVVATTGVKAGVATAAIDVAADLDRARRTLDHLSERVPQAYR